MRNGLDLGASMRSITRSKRVPREIERKYLVVDTSGGEPFYQRNAISQNVFSRTGPYVIGYDAARALYSNVVMAPVMWIMRVSTEAKARVQSRTDSVWKYAEDHELERLIERPNRFYNGNQLTKALLASYNLDGNAYILKVRNRIGEVIELWYLPHWLVRPEYPSGGNEYIEYYSFTPNGIAGRSPLVPSEEVAPRDMVHLRFGLDPENPRMGLSPLRSLLQEVFTDDEAARFSAGILRNMGVPGLLISPKTDVPMDPDAIVQTKQEVVAATSGPNRGNTLVFGRPTEAKQFGFDPGQLQLGELRNVTEERVCAIMGIPAAVVGFGSGLQSTKVGATMRELVALAWNTCIIPQQKDIADQFTQHLLPDFVGQPRRFRVRFDTTDVSAFQDDIDTKARTVGDMVSRGYLRLDRAQEMMGVEVDPSMAFYTLPANTVRIDENGNPIDPPPSQSPKPGVGDDTLPSSIQARLAGATNGNGTKPTEES